MINTFYFVEGVWLCDQQCVRRRHRVCDQQCVRRHRLLIFLDFRFFTTHPPMCAVYQLYRLSDQQRNENSRLGSRLGELRPQNTEYRAYVQGKDSEQGNVPLIRSKQSKNDPNLDSQSCMKIAI